MLYGKSYVLPCDTWAPKPQNPSLCQIGTTNNNTCEVSRALSYPVGGGDLRRPA